MGLMLKRRSLWIILPSVLGVFLVIFALWYKGWLIWYFWQYQTKKERVNQDAKFFIEQPEMRVDEKIRTSSRIPGITLNDFFINDFTLLAVRPRNIFGSTPPLDLLLTFEAQDQTGKSQHYAFWTTYAGCSGGPIRLAPLPSLKRFSSYGVEVQVFTAIEDRDDPIKILGNSPACAVYAKGKVAQPEELIKYLQGGEARFAGKIRDLRRETIIESMVNREDEMKRMGL